MTTSQSGKYLDAEDERVAFAQRRIPMLIEKLLVSNNRSPLVRFKHSRRSRTQLRFVNVSMDGAFKALTGQRSIRLLSLPAPSTEPPDEQTEEFVLSYEIAQSQDEEFLDQVQQLDEQADNYEQLYTRLERELKDRVRDLLRMPPRRSSSAYTEQDIAELNDIDHKFELEVSNHNGASTPRRIQTLLFPDRYQAVTSAIRTAATQSTQEMGIHTLHVAFGFLEWYESDASDSAFLSPLLLLPVGIDRVAKSGAWEYSLKGTGDDPEVNPTLNARLLELGVKLPDSQDFNSVESFVKKCEVEIRNQSRWRIRTMTTLSNFRFSGIELVNDLDESNWPAGKGPSQHEGVATLLAGGSTSSETDPPEYDFTDKKNRPEIPRLILPADASQLATIIDIQAGQNMAVQGPPGTGKSQTIANLIGASLAEGKSILFIADKMAALDVVKNRLDYCGLGEYVLELHSTRATRHAVLESLGSRLDAGRNKKTYSSRPSIQREYDGLSGNLDEYAELLNQPFGKLDMTVHDVIWAYLNRELDQDDRVPDIPIRSLSGYSLQDIERVHATLRAHQQSIAPIKSRWTCVQNHPWSWVSKRLSPVDVSDLPIVLDEYKDALDDFMSSASDLVTTAGFMASTAEDGTHELLNTIRSIPEPSSDIRVSNVIPMLVSAQSRGSAARLINLFDEREVVDDQVDSYLRTPLSTASEAAIQSIELTELDNRTIQISDLSNKLTEQRLMFWRLQTLKDITRPVHLQLFQSKDVSTNTSFNCLRIIELIRKYPTSVLALISTTQDPSQIAELFDSAKTMSGRLGEERALLETRFSSMETADPAELRKHASVLRSSSVWSRLISRHKPSVQFWMSQVRNPDEKSDLVTKAQELERLADFRLDLARYATNADLLQIFGGAEVPIDVDWVELASITDFWEEAEEVITRFAAAYQPIVREYLVSTGSIDLKSHSSVVVDVDTDFQKSVGDDQSGSLDSISVDELIVQYSRRIENISSFLQEIDVIPLKSDCRAADAYAVQGLVRNLANIDRNVEQEKAIIARLSEVEVELPRDRRIVQQALDYLGSVEGATLPEETANILCSQAGMTFWQELRDGLVLVDAAIESLAVSEDKIIDLTGVTSSHPLMKDRRAFQEKKQDIDELVKQSGSLGEWATYLGSRHQLLDRGLGGFDEYIQTNDSDLEQVFDRVFWRAAVREVVEQNPKLSDRSGVEVNELRRLFVDLDSALEESNRESIGTKLDKNRPPLGNNTGPRSTWTELALVRHNVQLQKPRVTVRDLMGRAGRSIQKLKPCFMMSPSSVARFLQPGGLTFDLVIIDEASQMRPEEAIGALARGRQIVVVGDTMQLPPTRFFDRTVEVDEDDEMEEEVDESILEMALTTFHPHRSLLWHYRSRHDSLIAFSNKEFYENRLIVFPSPHSISEDLGVTYRHVEGQYKGGINPIEAADVALAALHSMRTHPDRSLGIAAMNSKQAELIQLELDRFVIDDKSGQDYIRRWDGSLEPLFVKNLENVQGDERDHIIVSTVYGPDDSGRVLQRFGPVNQSTGHRRLNVLFTRAKERLDIHSSMTASDIIVSPTSSWGVRTLKGYLEYAATGVLETGEITDRPADSDFELYVASALRSHGYEAIPQVGVAGYFVDLGIRHPSFPHGYVAGIECDGAAYHSDKYARDRDLLRQQVIEGLGWNIYRIWSTDWFRDPKGELRKATDWLALITAEVVAKANNRTVDVEMDAQPSNGIDTNDQSEHTPSPKLSDGGINTTTRDDSLADVVATSGSSRADYVMPRDDRDWARILFAMYGWAKNNKKLTQTEWSVMYDYAWKFIDGLDVSEYDRESVLNLLDVLRKDGFHPPPV
jgi:very-short-patch-repair endonuclease